MCDTNYAQYYALEHYLFSVVSSRFRAASTLSAFDFFCIVIWKANRSKSKIASRLLAQGDGHANLEGAVRSLVQKIAEAQNGKARLSVLIQEWGFRLPMASAILTVLYPDEFTVYDVRVYELLGDFGDAQYKTNFNCLWDRYIAYLKRVKSEVPEAQTLRDKDRFLWGKSFALQLQSNIEERFGPDVDDTEFDA